jgi:hypothetical protein
MAVTAEAQIRHESLIICEQRVEVEAHKGRVVCGCDDELAARLHTRG